MDIRTIPQSRHNPQFGQIDLAESLTQSDIRYIYMKNLGGLRSGLKDSPNQGWHNQSFRSYADYMQSPEFMIGIAELIEIAEQAVTAIMCAEAVPWRCHRSLVADALLIRGVEVLDIMDATHLKPETLTSFAKVCGQKIIYPSEQESLNLGLE